MTVVVDPPDAVEFVDVGLRALQDRSGASERMSTPVSIGIPLVLSLAPDTAQDPRVLSTSRNGLDQLSPKRAAVRVRTNRLLPVMRNVSGGSRPCNVPVTGVKAG